MMRLFLALLVLLLAGVAAAASASVDEPNATPGHVASVASANAIDAYDARAAATTSSHDARTDTHAAKSSPRTSPGVVRLVSGYRRAANGAEDAFDVAAAGGNHAGFLKNYVGRSPAELDRGINSIGRQIAEHQRAIADPTSKIPNFSELDPRQQTALVTRKWPGDIARQREQLQILQRLRQGG